MFKKMKAKESFKKGLMARDYQTKKKYYLDAIALDPKMTDAWINLAIADFKLGNTPKAMENLKKAKESEPDKLQKMLIAYQVAVFKEQSDTSIEDAIKAYEKVFSIYKEEFHTDSIWRAYVRSSPDFKKPMTQSDLLCSKALTNIASIYLKTSKYDLAENALKRSLEFWCFDPFAWYNYGNLMNSRGNYEFAAWSYLAAIHTAQWFAKEYFSDPYKYQKFISKNDDIAHEIEAKYLDVYPRKPPLNVPDIIIPHN